METNAERERREHPERYYAPMCSCGRPLEPTRWANGFAIEYACHDSSLESESVPTGQRARNPE